MSTKQISRLRWKIIDLHIPCFFCLKSAEWNVTLQDESTRLSVMTCSSCVSKCDSLLTKTENRGNAA